MRGHTGFIRIVGLAMLLLPSVSAASPFDMFGPSAKDGAEGSAGVAAPADYSAVHINPAGLTGFDRTELSLGTRLIQPSLRVDTERPDPAPVPVLPQPHAALVFGAVVPGWGLLRDRVYFGFGMSVPTQVLTRFRAYDPAQPYYYTYDAGTEHYETNAAVGVKVFKWVSLGAGLRLGAGQRGVLFADIDPLRQRVNRQVFDAWQYSLIAPLAGVLLGPLRLGPIRLSAGASVRDELAQPVEVPASIGFDGIGADVFATITGTSNFSPRTFAAGGALTFDVADLWRRLHFIGPLTVKAAAWHQGFSRSTSPFLRIQARGGGEGLAALGLSDLLVLPGDDGGRVTPPGLVDIVQGRIAVVFSPLRDVVTFRGAYGYRPTPVPDQNGATNLIGNDAHMVSAGAGFNVAPAPLFDGVLRVDGAWQGQFLVPRTAEKLRDDDPVGDWTSSGVVHVVTLQLTYQF